MKQVDPNQLISGELSLDQPLGGLSVENESGEVSLRTRSGTGHSVALKEMAELLYCADAAMVFELCGGW